MNVYEKLLKVQTELKAPKTQWNKFGSYYFRNCEDIQEAAKPHLKEVNALLVVGDELVLIGDRYYVKATAKFLDCETGEGIVNTSFAREELDKKGMDTSQITGATSSYARKYALNGLFCIDDVKDSDTQKPPEEKQPEKPKNNTKPEQPKPEPPKAGEPEYKCEKCGTPFHEFDWRDRHYTVLDAYEISKKKCGGKALCNKCKKEAGIQ